MIKALKSRFLVKLISTLFLAGALGGCAQQVATPRVGVLGLSEPVGLVPAEGDAPSPATYPDALDTTPLPNAPIAVPRAGSRNTLDVIVTPDLETAYDAYFAGSGAKALKALDAARNDPALAGPVARYHLDARRVRTLIMMGRAADAEAFAYDLAKSEQQAFGTDVNALALRAEARLWLADYAGAERDARKVAAALSGWVLPTSYGGGPTNLAELVSLTTAQLRAYTVLAGAAVLDGRAAEALPWAEAAERGYNAVHYVGNHGLYGLYLRPYPDSYYGRAFNLLFLGAARAEAAGDPAAGRGALNRADAFFNAIGYRAGAVSSAALRAWMLYRIPGQENEALAQADRAVQAAIENGFPDFIWRIETLKGEILIGEGRLEEAEAAYRRADASVDLVSGALSSDRAKLRYGVGKETIGRRLAMFDIAAGDLDRLFQDLERGRARAFVDMLADRPVAMGREADLVAEIKSLTRDIRALRIKNMAPRGTSTRDAAREASLIKARAGALDRLALRDPELAAVHGARSATLAEARAALGPADRLIYALPLSDDQPVRFLVADREGARLHETQITGAELKNRIIAFRDAVDAGNDGSQKRTAGRLASRLGWSGLVAPGVSYVVASGDLFFMPWGALPTEARVVTLPTGGWLLREAARRDGGNAAGIIGDPNFGGALPQLEGAKQEARIVGNLIGVEPLISGDATRSALAQRLANGGRLLHIASHGMFDAERPLHSAIALSDGSRADLLTAAEIFAHPLAADLVVLSACETGMGRTVAGDDFLGLARSFYLGGARAVLNSLWPVADEGTLAFMTAFHEKAVRSGDYAGAWLAARRATEAAGYPPSVYGAFVLGGAARSG